MPNRFLKKEFKIIMPLLSTIDKLFDYSASGYYFSLLKISECYIGGICPISDLNKISRKLKVRRKKLLTFIKLASTVCNGDNFTLISCDKSNFWFNSFPLQKEYNKGCGRKKVSVSDSIKLSETNLVNLTLNQYKKLIKKYGEILVKRAMIILDEWLSCGSKEARKYLNKNNYGHFRADGWLINEAMASIYNVV